MKSTPRSRLLLVELICDLLIFAVCASICVAVLVTARSMSRESADLTAAVYAAESAAETWRANGAVPAQLGDCSIRSAPADESGALVITVLKDDRVLYTLTVGGDTP
ncbi:MAG: hypothetical protein EOM52_11270 [Clostridia bacterium]|nr:hypothetical protein [Clostridia bacterium]